MKARPGRRTAGTWSRQRLNSSTSSPSRFWMSFVALAAASCVTAVSCTESSGTSESRGCPALGCAERCSTSADTPVPGRAAGCRSRSSSVTVPKSVCGPIRYWPGSGSPSSNGRGTRARLEPPVARRTRRRGSSTEPIDESWQDQTNLSRGLRCPPAPSHARSALAGPRCRGEGYRGSVRVSSATDAGASGERARSFLPGSRADRIFDRRQFAEDQSRKPAHPF